MERTENELKIHRAWLHNQRGHARILETLIYYVADGERLTERELNLVRQIMSDSKTWKDQVRKDLDGR